MGDHIQKSTYIFTWVHFAGNRVRSLSQNWNIVVSWILFHSAIFTSTIRKFHSAIFTSTMILYWYVSCNICSAYFVVRALHSWIAFSHLTRPLQCSFYNLCTITWPLRCCTLACFLGPCNSEKQRRRKFVGSSPRDSWWTL